MSCLDDCESTWQAATAAAWQRHRDRLLAATTNEQRIASAQQLNADLKAADDAWLACALDCFTNSEGGPPGGGI